MIKDIMEKVIKTAGASKQNVGEAYDKKHGHDK